MSRRHSFMLNIRLACVMAATTALASFSSALAQPRQPIDLLIRGGKIVDGTGNPWFVGDVAIGGDRIISVGPPAQTATALRVIEARGLVVAPGFIDMHSHSDMTLFEDGSAPSKIRQGVTTEILGEDTSAGPSKGKLSARTVSYEGKTATWSTLGGYFEALERRGIATNVASYVGLGTLLDCVQGDSLARPDAAQIAAMQELLDEAMREGALGLSTMLASPRELAVTTDDIVELCRVVKRHGGIYSSHIRNEGTEVLAAVQRSDQHWLTRAGIPVDIIHLKIAEQSLWGRMQEIIELIDNARRAGVNVQANVYPYTRGNNDLVSIIPPWAHEGGTARLIERLKDRVAPRPAQERHSGWIAGLVQPLHGRRQGLVSHAGERPAERGQQSVRRPDDGSDHRGEIERARARTGSARRAVRFLDRREWLDRHDLRASHRKRHESRTGAALVLDRIRRFCTGDRRTTAARPSASQKLRHVSTGAR